MDRKSQVKGFSFCQSTCTPQAPDTSFPMLPISQYKRFHNKASVSGVEVSEEKRTARMSHYICTVSTVVSNVFLGFFFFVCLGCCCLNIVFKFQLV